MSTAPESATYAAALERSEAIDADIDVHPQRYRMLTGDRPTGYLHIGHYLASLRNRVRLQERGVETFVLIADYQVITDRDEVGTIGEHVHGFVLDYLACGIDPAKSTIFAHSAVPALNQLMLPFLSLVTLPELQRNPTVKDELAASGRPLSGLLLTYPVHQAADILFCKANVVPVGKDQLPHLEQTRVVARRFNQRYAGGRTVFPEPDALLTPAALILGVDGEKMAKSRGNSIEIRSTADETAKQIKRAKTDSERFITYDPVARPEVANLLTVAGLFRGEDPAVLAEQIGNGGGGALKAMVTEAINEGLAPIRARRAELVSDPAFVRGILARGNERANEVANATLAEVTEAMGMTYN